MINVWFGLPVPIRLFWIVLVILCAMDLKSHKVPDVISIPMIGVGLAYHCLSGGWEGFSYSLLGMWFGILELLCFGVLTYFLWLGRPGIGGADIKMAGAFGAWYGTGAVSVALLIGALLGILVMLEAKEDKGKIAFVPLMTLGLLCWVFFERV